MNDPAKIALVTGGSRGIGRAIVLDLARRGFMVHFTYLENEQAAFSVVDATKGFDGLVVPARVDARDVAACASFVARVIAEGGRIDLLVNNAGILSDRLLAMMTTDDWRSVVDTSLNGLFGMTQLTAKQMMRQRGGRIVNLSSVSGVVGIPGQTAYSAAKAAIIGFTRSLSKELARYGATVNAVAPGFIETPMTDPLSQELKDKMKAMIPLGRFGQDREIAAAIVFLASDEAGYITGQVLGVNGGMHAG
jgi:3-oxoacyl-[acyl-carrier protein] reductase